MACRQPNGFCRTVRRVHGTDRLCSPTAALKVDNFEDLAIYGYDVGNITDIEQLTGKDLNRDGNVTSDDQIKSQLEFDRVLSDELWYQAIKRQDPNTVEGTWRYSD